ncbi:hypothetical protein MAPG_08574 [Magnaporthiopsis poae ATCC 64411]|uniref:DM2 domain-containing protein n=1 Tax=Magnaporthiopsis poae (strain ATCC 64411 / 73-15) TaxID=644358 RepID=A0A0C4E7Q5_MAGP6|nr:hypothetical protein MAPG_08574 [Magnaporthiopsis poae ATCC 64411]
MQHQPPHASESARRLKSRRPTDKTIPDGVEDAIIGDGVARYRDLRDYERRLDATMTRKRLDIVDPVNKGAKRSKTMRIWISNTVDEQPWQAPLNTDSFDFSTSHDSSYRVKIEGRLLDDDDDDGGDHDENKQGEEAQKDDKDAMETDGPSSGKAKAAAKPQQRARFSHFFRAISVTVERPGVMQGPAGPEQLMEWKKPEQRGGGTAVGNPAADFDELTFKRGGDENVNVVISLTRHEEPERFSISPALADIVDMSEGTRTEITARLWDYIRLMGLQEEEEKRQFRCDHLLRKALGREVGGIPVLQEYITPHLGPLPPIKLAYTIRVDQEFHSAPGGAQPTVYDVQVLVDDPLRAALPKLSLPFSSHPNAEYGQMLREVARLDEQLSVLVGAVYDSKAKHAFFSQMQRDPANFVKGWLSSQQRDLEVIMGESVRGKGAGGDAVTGGDEWRRGGRDSVWATESAREGVSVLLARQPAMAGMR